MRALCREVAMLLPQGAAAENRDCGGCGGQWRTRNNELCDGCNPSRQRIALLWRLVCVSDELPQRPGQLSEAAAPGAAATGCRVRSCDPPAHKGFGVR